MQKPVYYLVNSITYYRLLMAPVLLLLIFTGRIELFSLLLPLSFFTDLIDGYLARKFNVTSTFGSRLDSIADDMNIFVAITGLFVFKMPFIKNELVIVVFLLTLYLVQTVMALIRYKKISSFHTYLAKIAAVLQGFFFILIFFLDEPPYLLFYFMAVITAIELIEEIILVIALPEWTTNVKGLFWVLKKKKNKD